MAGRADISYARIAATPTAKEAAMKSQLHNLPQRYRLLMREEAACTAGGPAEIENEIKHLRGALAAAANQR